MGVGELTCLVLLLPHCKCTAWGWALTVNTLKVTEGADWWFAPMNNRNTLDCLKVQMGQFVAYSQKAFPPVFVFQCRFHIYIYTRFWQCIPIIGESFDAGFSFWLEYGAEYITWLSEPVIWQSFVWEYRPGFSVCCWHNDSAKGLSVQVRFPLDSGNKRDCFV